MNIFEVHNDTTSRIEPFHSMFLAEALRVSLSENRSVFDEVWSLCAPDLWRAPLSPRVEAEVRLEDGKRIDICIFDDANKRLLGIEVKTSDRSSRHGQLEDYKQRLGSGDFAKHDVAIAYLTPWNRQRAREYADSVVAVEIFEDFAKENKNAKHISWLDIADVKWDGNGVWEQHQDFVHNRISNLDDLQHFQARNRSFDDFFAERAIGDFWRRLRVDPQETQEDSVILDLESLNGNPQDLVRALECLVLDEDNVRGNVTRRDRFAENSRRVFLEEPKYRLIHHALFNIADRYPHVWVEGESNYGIRVAHRCPGGSVSLITSKGTRYMEIGKRR